MKRLSRWIGGLVLSVCATHVSASTLMDGVTTLAAGWLSQAQSSDELWAKLESHARLAMPKPNGAKVPLVVMAPRVRILVASIEPGCS